MKSTLNGFNRLASYYDRLKTMVFGQTIHDSQQWFLKSIPPGANVLILGGGSGEILPPLRRMNPDAVISFVDASSSMLGMAKKRIPEEDKQKLRFIHGTENDLDEGAAFDAIVTHFFLDLFPDHKLENLCNHLGERLRPGGLWVVSDFVDGGARDRAVLWLMYRFFRFTCGIEADRLPDWEGHLTASGLVEVSSKFFCKKFIKSGLYRKR